MCRMCFAFLCSWRDLVFFWFRSVFCLVYVGSNDSKMRCDDSEREFPLQADRHHPFESFMSHRLSACIVKWSCGFVLPRLLDKHMCVHICQALSSRALSRWEESMYSVRVFIAIVVSMFPTMRFHGSSAWGTYLRLFD